ncbi:MAG TPA: hypothetical protein VIY86_00855 [Pirellulaceae bacterium]
MLTQSIVPDIDPFPSQGMDQVCTEFEQAVKLDDQKHVEETLRTWAGRDESGRLLLELLKIRMEYLLRGNPQRAELLAPKYAMQFPQLGSQDYRDLAAYEMLVRQLRGETSMIGDMAVALGDDSPAMLHALRQAIAKTSQPVIHISERGAPLRQVALTGELLVGRQDRHEPEPITLIRGDTRDKLVLAPMSDRKLSREQLLLSIASLHCVHATNTGTTLTIGIGVEGTLRPGNTVALQVGETVNIRKFEFRLALSEARWEQDSSLR